MKKAIALLTILIIVSLGRFAYPLVYQFFIDTALTEPTHKPAVIAHRGAAGQAPENTLAAFKLALDLQADIIEFDIHPSKDGALMVIHDSQLDRTTNGTGPVSAYTLAELKKLDAGSWFSPEFAGEPIPTLNEVLQLINGQTQCIIELKWDDNGYYPGLAARVAAVIAAVNGTSWCIVQSYEGKYLAELHQLNPNLKLVKAFIGLWPGPAGSFYYDTGLHWGNYQAPDYLWGVNIYFRAITKSQVADWHRQNIHVWSYTINTAKPMRKHINLGVDGIITDNPDQLRQILSSNPVN